VRKSSRRGSTAVAPIEAADTSVISRKDMIAAVLLIVAGGAIVANAAFLQSGPHPAPMFAAKPVPVAASPSVKTVRPAGPDVTAQPIPAAVPKARPAELEAARPEAPAQPRARAEVISDIQRELARKGFYDGTIDGVHGPKTDAAMRDFEQATGLRPGSEANDVFLRALQRSSVKATTASSAAAPAAPRHDPIADLIAPPTARVISVQRALVDYGYGQFRPNGQVGPETKDAIERFEKARKMPVTGQITPRLVRELSALTGRPLE
jgi:peptidoglycan hydrolase-like protein with peptidoglycan-binding domain